MRKKLWIWAKIIKLRDGKCVECGATKNLHAHHIIPRKKDPSQIFEVENGKTLCRRCHAKIEGFKKGHLRLPGSGSKKGIPSWNKGKKLSDEHRRKLKEAKIGYIPWNKGKRKKTERFKVCRICKVEKNITRFTPSHGWFSNRCKDCRNAALKIKRIRVV